MQELTATERQLELVVGRGKLDSATFESVRDWIEERRHHFAGRAASGRQRRAPVPSVGAAPVAPVPAAAWQELEQLLSKGMDIDVLSLAERMRAISLHLDLTEEDLARLSSSGQHTLARLLRKHGPRQVAVRAHRRLLSNPSSDSAFVVDRKSTRLNSSHANISYAVF